MCFSCLLLSIITIILRKHRKSLQKLFSNCSLSFDILSFFRVRINDTRKSGKSPKYVCLCVRGQWDVDGCRSQTIPSVPMTTESIWHVLEHGMCNHKQDLWYVRDKVGMGFGFSRSLIWPGGLWNGLPVGELNFRVYLYINHRWLWHVHGREIVLVNSFSFICTPYSF